VNASASTPAKTVGTAPLAPAFAETV
jgi:hypothetical protein